MTVIYVSNVASNGYSAGSDAADGLTKLTAKLTFDGAKAIAVAGDEIMFNDGLFTRAGAFSLNDAVSLNCNSYRGTELRCTTAGSRGFLLNNPDGTTVHIGPLVFNDSGLSQLAFEFYSGTNLRRAVFDRTKFMGGTQYTFRTDGNTGVEMEQPTFESATAAIAGAGFNTMGPQAFVDVNRPQLLLTGSNNGIYAQGTPATPAPIRVRGPYGQVSRPGVPVTALNFNSMNVVVDGDLQRLLEVPAAAGAISALITVRALPGSVMAPPVIRRVRGAVRPTGGYGIRIGSDGSSGPEDNLIPGGIITGCDLIGGGGQAHGIMFGSMNGGSASYNKLRGFGISTLSKLQQIGADIYENDAEDGTNNTDGYSESKGSGAIRGACFAFNNYKIRAGYENVALYVQADPIIPTQNAKASWIANNVHMMAGTNMPRIFFVNNDGSVCNFIHFNNYHSLGAVGANAMQYQGLVYPSVAAWKSALEATVTEWSPGSLDLRFWKHSYLPLRMMAFRNQPVLHQVFPVMGI